MVCTCSVGLYKAGGDSAVGHERRPNHQSVMLVIAATCVTPQGTCIGRRKPQTGQACRGERQHLAGAGKTVTPR